MNTTRSIAAAFAACTTFAVLSAVVSIAEPQRSTLIAKQSAPAASQAVQLAVEDKHSRRGETGVITRTAETAPY
jgi:hypothetical protein